MPPPTYEFAAGLQVEVLRAMLDALPEAVLAIDPASLRVLAVNRAAGVLWGCEPAALCGRAAGEIFSPPTVAALSKLTESGAAAVELPHVGDLRRLSDETFVACRLQAVFAGEGPVVVVAQSCTAPAIPPSTCSPLAGYHPGELPQDMAKMGEMAGRGEMGEMTPLLPQSWATVPARLDPLTCLPDRAALVAELERAIVALRSGRGAAFALLFIDLDQFKQVNDRWGHLTGDGVLEAIARRLRSSVRPGDLVARLGGDEFAALLREVSKPRDAAAVAERICRQMATPIDYEGETLVLGASIGVAMSSPDVPDPATILKRADRAMYQAKARGGGGYAVWE